MAIHYPDGGTERFIRDGAGNRIKHILPEQYDPATDDGAGYGYTYDAEDRLAHQVLEDRENDIRLLTRFSYDRGGNLIQVVQQGREGQRELSCTYDLKDRLTGVKELGGRCLAMVTIETTTGSSKSAAFPWPRRPMP